MFFHISTAYVNSNRKGLVEEKIYEDGPNLDLVDMIMNMDDKELAQKQDKMIKDFKFDNSYTFAKHLAEKNLRRNQGDLPTVLYRPTIVGCSEKEPMPAWTDSLSAAGVPTLLGGMGLATLFHVDGSGAIDIIPADIVTNGVLVILAGTVQKYVKFDVFNCGSSELNPVSKADYLSYGLTATKTYSFRD